MSNPAMIKMAACTACDKPIGTQAYTWVHWTGIAKVLFHEQCLDARGANGQPLVRTDDRILWGER